VRIFLKKLNAAAQQCVTTVKGIWKKTVKAVGSPFVPGKFVRPVADSPSPKNNAALKKAQQNIYWQAGLAGLTIVLTIVIVFTMTSAWYTNVVQTSALVIEAESWGFDGVINVNDAVVSAAPGDEGVIHLEVVNDSESTSAVSVGVSKTRMGDAEMRKRLYFYVDTQAVRGDESVERVYLNTQESYTYTVFGKNKLMLTEETHNDAQVKWQWVYDMLGYYVLGSWSEENQRFVEMEYLRPIEYDYDQATAAYKTEEDGVLTMELKTVDGETTLEQFIEIFSETDGYEGVIDADSADGKVVDMNDRVYYKVDVDKNGTGVYAYLCTYAEIEQATMYDTMLAKKTAEALEAGVKPESYEVQLIVSAQKNDEDIVSAGSLTGLQTALEMNSGCIVQLTEDITLSSDQVLTIPKDTQFTLDLNGHTITTQSSGRAIDAMPGSSLTLLNGNLEGNGTGYGIYATGAEVVCNGVEIKDFNYSLYVGDHVKVDGQFNNKDSKVRLVDCTIDGKSYGIVVSGNGSLSSQKSQLIIEHSTITSDLVAISGNGDVSGNGRWGTDIQIIDSSILINKTITNENDNLTALTTAIYHPQKDSTLTIYKSSVYGYTGLAIKGGTVSVYDATIHGWGEALDPVPNNSGCSDTGNGIYVETNYGYDILLQIAGNDTKVSGLHADAIQIYEPEASNVKIRIYAGQFSHLPDETWITEASRMKSENPIDNMYVVEMIPEETEE